MTDIAHFPRPGQNYPYISFLSQGSTNISYTVWFSSHWTEQNSANLLKIEIVANAVLCHTYAWFSVAKFSTTHTVWHIVYNADSTSTSLHLVLALSTYRFIAPRASTSVASVWFDDRKRNPLQEPLEPLNWSRLQSISTSCQEMEFLTINDSQEKSSMSKFCKLLIISTSSLWFPLGAKPINAPPPSVGGGSSPIPW